MGKKIKKKTYCALTICEASILWGKHLLSPFYWWANRGLERSWIMCPWSHISSGERPSKPRPFGARLTTTILWVLSKVLLTAPVDCSGMLSSSQFSGRGDPSQRNVKEHSREMLVINESRKGHHHERKGPFSPLKSRRGRKGEGKGWVRKRCRRTERWKGRHKEEDRNGKQIRMGEEGSGQMWVSQTWRTLISRHQCKGKLSI